MNQMKSARVQIIRFLFVLPLMAVLLLAFREARQNETKQDFIQTDVLLADTLPADEIKSVRVNKNNNEQSVTIILKNGTKETYNLNNEIEKAAFEKKYGKLDKLVPPPPPPPTPATIAPSTPVHEIVKLNEKGYYVTIADNLGECIVIVKDKKKNIVEALKLTDWTLKEAAYEKKYGKIPPPPPPTPDVPAAVSVVSPVSTTAAVSAPAEVSTIANVSTANEVVVTGYGTTATSPANPLKEVTVVGYATSATATSPEASNKEVIVKGYKKIESSGRPVTVEGYQKSPMVGSALSNSKGTITIGLGYGYNNENILYIVDGKETDYDELRTFDVNTIESVSVLKDESAVKAYGQKGKNGVVIIKTKTKKTSFKFFTTPWKVENEKC